MCIGLGGSAFWGCFGLIKLIAGASFSGKSVGFLMLFEPLVIWIIIWLWHKTVVPPAKRNILAAIAIGIVGPLVFTVIYSLVAVSIPTAQMGSASFNNATDYLLFIGLSVTLGPLSVLTYTGMLGAFVVNLISSPFVGWWISRGIKESPI